MVIIPKARRKKLTLAIGLILATGTVNAAFPAQLELSGLNGSNGFTINGVSAGDYSGTSVSMAGDINGDGVEDLVIGAPYASTNAEYAGAAYVIFGSDLGFPNPLNLSSLDGSNGFVINGTSAGDYSGASVSAGGDINGDGIDDLLIGAPGSSPYEAYAGASYVVFGSGQAWNSAVELSSLDGGNGFAINGAAAYDESGVSVSAAGDINGDGVDDLIIGAPYAGSGAAYVVFGRAVGETWDSALELSGLNGSNGFVINGASPGASFGVSVSAAGDVNNDNTDDLVIGAIFASNDAGATGAAYVVFGSSEAWSSPFDISGLDGNNGIVVNGMSAGDNTGIAVGAAGDINVDGMDDLIIGASLADPNGDGSGASYVVFGSGEAWTSPFSLAGLNGANGFVINGVSTGDNSGISVGAAGDINVDGKDDLAIGAPFADPNGESSGAGYVVFGSDEAWTSTLNLSGLNGANGFVFNGVNAGDGAGVSVNGAGDINGDGFDDLVTGALLADPNGTDSGASYVIFGAGEQGDLIFADSFE
ncbi:MAG: integrin alpha [Gammaproteobacteria bacterium]|nr:integrin alpha [Gammaproteobacteria bacterium]